MQCIALYCVAFDCISQSTVMYSVHVKEEYTILTEWKVSIIYRSAKMCL